MCYLTYLAIAGVNLVEDMLDMLMGYTGYYWDVAIGRAEFYMADEQVEYRVTEQGQS